MIVFKIVPVFIKTQYGNILLKKFAMKKKMSALSLLFVGGTIRRKERS